MKDEFLDALKQPLEDGRLGVDSDYGGLLRTIEARFPIVGSTIDWSEVPSSISAGELGMPDSRHRFQEWFAGVVASERLTGRACVVGDGPVELGIVGSVQDILDNLLVLTNLPQHTFVIAYPNGEWCACLSFEGYMDFGYAVK